MSGASDAGTGAPGGRGPAFTWQATVAGVVVVGFADRSESTLTPDATLDGDVAEFGRRMEHLLSVGIRFAVVDFSGYRITDGDNGRAVLSSLLSAHRQLADRGGGLLVCHHPAQLNPDLQGMFKFDRIIGIYRDRQAAIAAVQARE